MTRADWAWAGVLAAACVLETTALYGGRVDDTLSARTRSWCRTSSPAGRACFAVGWSVFAIWFLDHITEARERRP